LGTHINERFPPKKRAIYPSLPAQTRSGRLYKPAKIKGSRATAKGGLPLPFLIFFHFSLRAKRHQTWSERKGQIKVKTTAKLPPQVKIKTKFKKQGQGQDLSPLAESARETLTPQPGQDQNQDQTQKPNSKIKFKNQIKIKT
jgi:hypothetical protein